MGWISILIVFVLGVISVVAFLPPLMVRYKRLCAAPGDWGQGDSGARLKRFIFEVCLQSKVIVDRPLAGFAHALVFWGFLFFMFATLDHFCLVLGFSPIHWFGVVGRGFLHVTAIWAVLVTIGILFLAYRRFIMRPKALGEHLSVTSGLVAFLIVLLMVTYLLGLYCLGESPTAWLVNWWIHALAILVFPPLIVRSKHLHLLVCPFTIYLRDEEIGRIEPLNFEAEELGVEKAGELRKQIVLGAFSCVECGRCQDSCPAFNTGKKLNPKEISLAVRDAVLEGPDKVAVGEYIDKEMLWGCTTCGACVHQCPVGCEQLAPLLEFRRSQVSEGEFPEPFGNLFKNLERSGNPWNYAKDKADDRIEELDIPIYKDQEVLWWMGCMARYDDTCVSATHAFSRILKAAGVSFGVLKKEKCTGDPARRAGNEMAFVELATHNIELLNEIDAKVIVSTCPHCLKALEDYMQLGENQFLDAGLRSGIKLIHSTRYIRQLYEGGKLALKGEAMAPRVITHDPCYLSRHECGGDEKDMQFLIDMAGSTSLKPERSGKQSFCCGGGGAQAFDDESGDSYIYNARIEELLAKGNDPIATACPFCRMMLQDGCKDHGIEDKDRVVDVLELVAKRLQ